MARHVEDLQAMMPILLGIDAEDHTVIPMPYDGIPMDRFRIAYFTSNGFSEPDADTKRVVAEAGKALGGIENRPPGMENAYELEMSFLGADGGWGA
jgi:hypothetical protein